ncbi:MAG: UDP-N-acetylglucosamine 2-epimerase (non-hydrolyzing) [Chloroflexaceae bacterium]|nr:UDP-N-acetylglucosamine 2-epimerase (non-hydrolyzing) [Chloroflexaceae bacterium]
MKIVHVVGARPNFMKAAPVIAALKPERQIQQVLVHTGQHYDQRMSSIFFTQLGLPPPDVNLGVGSASHTVQLAQTMLRLEPVLAEQFPDLVLVYGDVNSTLAAALVSSRLGLRVGHVEAGLRSFDRTMPEEINRLLTDQIADLLFTPSQDANQHLQREGIPAEKVFLVGNVMIDTLVRLLPQAMQQWHDNRDLHPWQHQPYALVTLHRPSNVDTPAMLTRIMATLAHISESLPVIFPIHPRTSKRLDDLPLEHKPWCMDTKARLHLVEPLGYLDFLALQRHATLVITDSGGIQEETTFLGVPCLTLRENTERPVTLTHGSNILIGHDMNRLHTEVARILAGQPKQGALPMLWDGHAAERIATILVEQTASRRETGSLWSQRVV